MDGDTGEAQLEARSIEDAVQAVFAWLRGEVSEPFRDAEDRTLGVVVSHRFSMAPGFDSAIPIVYLPPVAIDDQWNVADSVVALAREIEARTAAQDMPAGELVFDCRWSVRSCPDEQVRRRAITRFDPAWLTLAPPPAP